MYVNLYKGLFIRLWCVATILKWVSANSQKTSARLTILEGWPDCVGTNPLRFCYAFFADGNHS